MCGLQYVFRCIGCTFSQFGGWCTVFRLLKTKQYREGNDQWPHLYAVHNLATAAVASSLCMHLFQTGVHVFPPPAEKAKCRPRVCRSRAAHERSTAGQTRGFRTPSGGCLVNATLCDILVGYR